jgi:hypothetical protein
MLNTLASLVRQIARLVPSPSARLSRHRSRSASMRHTRECYGLCPFCRQFVAVRFAVAKGSVACPRCGRLVDSLHSPGPA